jgi:hypothetical protein
MNKIVGFCAVIHFPHPKIKNLKKIHRIVLLPEFQGLGLAGRFLNSIAEIYSNKNFEVGITTSLKSFIISLKKNPHWIMQRYGRVGVAGKSSSIYTNKNSKSTSRDRLTASFFFKNKV